MILRRSRATDLPALQTLWQEVFGDPPAFTERFYETFGENCALVAEVNGRIVAMIHPLPVALAQNGQYVPGVYVYALATHPDQRGKGIASQLLTAAETAPFSANPLFNEAVTAELAKRGGNTPMFSLLIPANESLFAYYRARGYHHPAQIVPNEQPDYAAHLAQGLADEPIFLKPRPFYELSMRIPESFPLPPAQALWKSLSPNLCIGKTPILSHFMQ